MVLAVAISASLVASTWAHGFMVSPVVRQQGASSLSEAGTTCGYCSCCWYTNKVSIPGEPINCDPNLGTHGSANPCQDSYTLDKPWRSPGTAPIHSPCGASGGSDGGTTGESLPPAERSIWQVGSIVEVAQAITANHGGGYAYRLCPVDSAPTEECFQAHHLQFADETTTVHHTDGLRESIPSLNFTTPEGRQWKKNPIPKSADTFPVPCQNCQGDHWPFSLVDRVILPNELPAGDYLISWRWDCEGTPQVWSNCGDVTLVNGLVPGPSPSPAPAPPTPPKPMPAPTPNPSPTPKPPTPAPKPPAHPTCCWSGWGDADSCGGYPKGSGGARCNTDWSKSCNSDGDCKSATVV